MIRLLKKGEDTKDKYLIITSYIGNVCGKTIKCYDNLIYDTNSSRNICCLNMGSYKINLDLNNVYIYEDSLLGERVYRCQESIGNIYFNDYKYVGFYEYSKLNVKISLNNNGSGDIKQMSIQSSVTGNCQLSSVVGANSNFIYYSLEVQKELLLLARSISCKPLFLFDIKNCDLDMFYTGIGKVQESILINQKYVSSNNSNMNIILIDTNKLQLPNKTLKIRSIAYKNDYQKHYIINNIKDILTSNTSYKL